MARLSITFACWPYDRVEPLKDGIVKPDGIDLRFLPSHPGDTFLRMLEYKEFEASELGLSTCFMTTERNGDFVGIPVFTSRTFRHNGLFINTRSGIREPQDLSGKKIGLPEYQITSAVWIKGILQHEYGVRPESVEWYVERWGRGRSHAASLGFKPPDGISVKRIPKDESQFSFLRKGKLDAAFIIQEIPSSICRSSLRDLSKPVRDISRLFRDYKKVEMEYYRRTGIFPIMHAVVLRRDVYERHRWAAKSLYEVLCESKRRFYESVGEWELFSFPWIRSSYEEAREILGEDPYPYGLNENRKVLETLSQYCFEQGLTKHQLEPEDLFAEETLDT